MSPLPTVSSAQARTLLLEGQGLLADPGRRPTPAALLRSIRQLGFVQLDTIQVVERAHHLTLGARFRDYRPAHLDALRQRRWLFEHFTHDASLLPIDLYPHWKRRFRRYRALLERPRWRQRLAPGPERRLRRVADRVRREGALRARDFEGPRAGPGGWWTWKPDKAALELLWRIGRLGVAERDGFQKLYDLPARLFPAAHGEPMPGERAHVDWACETALARLGAATPAELAHYWASVPVAAARDWCRRAERRGDALPVLLASEEGAAPVRGVARPDWRRRVDRAPAPPREARLLAPFDPVVRDRGRARRVFGFDYTFEAFVPAAKRHHGYYVLPLIQGDRPIARLDARHQRDRQRLDVLRLHWEPGREDAAARRGLEDALGALCGRIGATDYRLPR